MTGRISEEKIREIRERTDIVTVVSSYLPLRRAGANHVGLCPFHAEKTPSFNVNPARQIFHCFGCDTGGDVFSFLMRMEGLAFPEAAKRLGERAGIEIEEETLSAAEIKEREEKARLTRINEVACDFYHRLLLEDKSAAKARQYLKSRGYDGEAARRFRLGYAPGGSALAEHLNAQGIDPRWGRELGLLRERDGRDADLFYRRLLFPILDLRGQVVAFGGRVLDEALPKYLNSPESRIYHKSRLLFGLYQAREGMRQSGEGILVEGYFDQMALDQAGFRNAVATCGTALTADQARLLKRYAQRVILLFDQDKAGQKAIFRAMDVLLEEGVAAAVVALDAGEDPDSFLGRKGSEAFRERLAAARPVLEAFMDSTLEAHGNSIEGKARAVDEILPRLRRLTSEIERELYLKRLGERTGVAAEVLRRQGVKPLPAGDKDAAPAAPRKSIPPPTARPKEPGAGHKAQQWLLQLMLLDKAVRQKVAAEGVEKLFCTDTYRQLGERVVQLGENEPPEVLLAAGLAEEQKTILSGILIKDEKVFADEPEGVFLGCRQAVERERLKLRIEELDAQIRQAEKEDDSQQRLILGQEKLKLNRQLKGRDLSL